MRQSHSGKGLCRRTPHGLCDSSVRLWESSVPRADRSQQAVVNAASWPETARPVAGEVALEARLSLFQRCIFVAIRNRYTIYSKQLAVSCLSLVLRSKMPLFGASQPLLCRRKWLGCMRERPPHLPTVQTIFSCFSIWAKSLSAVARSALRCCAREAAKQSAYGNRYCARI
jgi:hypothetical protein